MHILGHYLSQNALRAKLFTYKLFGAKSKRMNYEKKKHVLRIVYTIIVIAYHNKYSVENHHVKLCKIKNKFIRFF